jgi:uncharacterized protein YkwD
VPVQFDGSGSSDPEGEPLSYVWKFGNGQITPASLSPRSSIAYISPGTFTVTLTVTDNLGLAASATTTATITAAPPPPPPEELRIVATVVATPQGAFFNGTVFGPTPLPVGSTITVTAREPDGRTATGTATIVGDAPPPPPPPPPTDPDAAEKAEAIRLINVERANAGAAALRAMANPARAIAARMSALQGQDPGFLPTPAAAVAGRGPLTNRAELARAAQDFATDLHTRGVLTHTGADGSDPGTRMRRAGWSGNTWGEVAGRGFSNAQSMVVGWMNSPGHRAILLDPNMREIGMGFVRDGGYWVGDTGG